MTGRGGGAASGPGGDGPLTGVEEARRPGAAARWRIGEAAR
jgi:hypothetical protein